MNEHEVAREEFLKNVRENFHDPEQLLDPLIRGTQVISALTYWVMTRYFGVERVEEAEGNLKRDVSMLDKFEELDREQGTLAYITAVQQISDGLHCVARHIAFELLAKAAGTSGAES